MAFRTISALILLFSISLSSSSQAEEFVAVMVNTNPEGVFEGRVFASNDKVAVVSYDSTRIVRADRKETWLLFPRTKIYREEPFDYIYLIATTRKIPGEIKRMHIGKARISGVMTDKYQVVYEVDGKRSTVFQWLDSETALPMKTSTQDGSWVMEYKGISPGPQPYELFEIPKGYKEEGSVE